MQTIVLASKNKHKAEEIQAILQGLPWRIEPLRADVSWDESSDSFYGNALIKARAVQGAYPSQWVLADDSGLCVEALGGAPGVYSSRYAGKEGDDQGNLSKLLKDMEHIPPDKRGAFFVCQLILLDPSGHVHAWEGRCYGDIIARPTGLHGFGYDPVFVPRGYTQTFAEMPASEKNRVSHRAEAMGKFCEFLSRSR